MTDAPPFRFYPSAYDPEKGQFQSSQASCDVCQNPCVWEFTGTIYMIGTEPKVCARCLHSGALKSFLSTYEDTDRRAQRSRSQNWDPSSFSLHDIDLESEINTAIEDELLERTPTVDCFNPFEWPVQDGMPMAWIGTGREKSLIKSPAIWAAMKKAWSDLWPDEVLTGPTDYLLIFQSLDGAHFRAVVDLD